jgi:hypothetical protein
MPCVHSRVHTLTNAPLQLPPMLLSEDMCRRCFANKTCALYHKAVEGGSAQSSGMDSKFDELTGVHTFSHHAETACVQHSTNRARAREREREREREKRGRVPARAVCVRAREECDREISVVGTE